jgi:hypothetical protein
MVWINYTAGRARVRERAVSVTLKPAIDRYNAAGR